MNHLAIDITFDVTSLVQSVKGIELLQDSLSRLPKLSHLIVTDVIQGNPLRCILPSDKIIESIEYGRARYSRDTKFLDEIDTFLRPSAFFFSASISAPSSRQMVKPLPPWGGIKFDMVSISFQLLSLHH